MSSRRRVFRVALALLLAVVVGIGGLLAWTQTRHFERSVARALSWRLSEVLGERVVVGAVGVDWWARAIDVGGVVVSHRADQPDLDGQVIVALARGRLVLGIHQLRPTLRRVELDQPIVSLHLDADGLREFRALTGDDGGDGEVGTTRLPWRELVIRGGSFSMEAGQTALRVEGIDVAPIIGSEDMDVRFGAVSLRLGALEKVARAVAFPRARLSADRLVLPEVDLDFGDLRVKGNIAAVLGGELRGDLHVEAGLPGLSPLLGDHWLLEGAAELELEVTGTTQAPAAKGALVLDDVALQEAGVAPGKGSHRYELGSMVGGWRFAGRQVFLEPLVARWADGAVTINGAMDLASTGTWLSIGLEGASLYRALQQAGASSAPWVDLIVDGELHAAGTLSPLDVAGSLRLASDRLLVGSGDARDPDKRILALRAIALDGQLRLNPDQIRLDIQRLKAGGTTGSVVADIGLAGRGPLDLRADFSRLDLGAMRPLYDLDLTAVGALQLHLHGPFSALELDGAAELSDLHLLGYKLADQATLPFATRDMAELHFDGFQARIGRSVYAGALGIDLRNSAALDLQVILQRGQLSDLVGVFVDAPGLEGDIVGTLDLHGPGNALNGEVELQLSAVDLWGERFPDGEASVLLRDGDWLVDDLGLWRAEGRESLLLRGSVAADGALNLDLHGGGFTAESMDLVAPLDLPFRASLSLDARIKGSLSRPEPNGRVALRDSWLLGEPVGDSTITVWSDRERLSFEGTLFGDNAATVGDLDLWNDLAWRVGVDLRDFPAEIFHPRAADGGAVRARLSGAAEFSGRLSDPGRPVRIAAEARTIDLGWADQTLRNNQPCRFTSDAGSFLLSRCEIKGGNSSVYVEAERTPAAGLALSGGGKLDLALARAVVPDLQRAEGSVGVELSVTGPRGALVPRVNLQTRDAYFRGAWFPAPFEQVNATIEGGPQGYTINELRGRVGGGVFTASGDIEADTWVPRRYDTRGSVRGARVRYLDYLPPIVGDAELRFDGPIDDLLLSGRIDVSDMFFNERIDWESWILEVSGGRLDSAVAEASSDALFALDLELVARDTVRMRNNVGDLQASADLRFIGDTSRAGMVGEVRAVRGGRLYLKEREFELIRGELRWVDPYAYDPELDILLRTDVRSRDQEYRIDYRVLGNYSDWSTETSSDPPLAVADINALLLFGMTRSDLEKYGGLASVLATEGSDLLVSRFGIVEGVGESIYRIGFFDVLLEGFRPDRLDLVSGASERGSGSLSSDLRLLYEKDLVSLDPRLAETRLIFEQNVYRLSDFYLGFEQKLSRSLYARGFWSGESLGGPAIRGGAYGLEFNVRWEID